MKSPEIRMASGKSGAGKCPTCKAPTNATYKPFCSKRCADVDLHRWLAEGYAIPAVETDDEPDPQSGDD